MSVVLSFDADHAKKYGVNAAILLFHFRHWIELNHAANRNSHEGKTWTYHKLRELEAHFSFLSNKKIRNALDILCAPDGPMVKGNFNASKYDRTLWYAFKNQDDWIRSDYKKANKIDQNINVPICPRGQMENEKRANGITPEGRPIPDNNTDNNTDISSIPYTPFKKGGEKKSEKIKFGNFVYLNPEEINPIKEICGGETEFTEIVNEIDDYLLSTGKKPYKDYAATIRNWIRKRKKELQRKDYFKWKQDNHKMKKSDYKSNSSGPVTLAHPSQGLSLGEMLMNES